jgi:DNA-binding SARP family transcriptional activator
MRLALDAGRTVSLGGLVDAVWEQEVPADEVHALQSLVSRLRRALGDAALVAQTPGGYRLALEPADVDAHRFERLAREGASALRAGEPGRAGQLLGEALALWRGPALAGVAGTRAFATAAAARLEDVRLAATVGRIEADLAGTAPGEITVFVNLGTNVDVQPLAVGQLIDVTGFSSQFTDHYEIDIRGPQDLAQPVR